MTSDVEATGLSSTMITNTCNRNRLAGHARKPRSRSGSPKVTALTIVMAARTRTRTAPLTARTTFLTAFLMLPQRLMGVHFILHPHPGVERSPTIDGGSLASATPAVG